MSLLQFMPIIRLLREMCYGNLELQPQCLKALQVPHVLVAPLSGSGLRLALA